jgi:hypothetical protein
MPQLAVQGAGYSPALGFDCSFGQNFGQNDEAMTSQVYAGDLRDALKEIYRSFFWRSKARFAEVRQRLKTTVSLGRGWDTYGAESPNDLARTLAAKVLDALEAELLPPTRLMPSSEGGIAISFVEGDNRAEIEIYNTGEIAAATYSAHSEPVAWELSNTESALKNAIVDIRVRLTA